VLSLENKPSASKGPLHPIFRLPLEHYLPIATSNLLFDYFLDQEEKKREEAAPISPKKKGANKALWLREDQVIQSHEALKRSHQTLSGNPWESFVHLGASLGGNPATLYYIHQQILLDLLVFRQSLYGRKASDPQDQSTSSQPPSPEAVQQEILELEGFSSFLDDISFIDASLHPHTHMAKVPSSFDLSLVL